MADKTIVEEAGFFGRWSKRKVAVEQGRPVAEPAPPHVATPQAGSGTTAAGLATTPIDLQTDKPVEEAHALSLEDVKALTNDSDYKPFMAGNVSPDVRNAAMRKLFADPQFNVMDGLDIYIDDYSISDPIPESMLRQMVSAKFLNLFDDEEEEAEKKDGTPESQSTARDNAEEGKAESVAQSGELLDRAGLPAAPVADTLSSPDITSQPDPRLAAEASLPDHDDTHLRLQPDHAAAAPEAGRGA